MRVTDDKGAFVDQVVVVTVSGTNDAAVITGTTTGSITEDSGAQITGQLTATDVDAGATLIWSGDANEVITTGTYGSFVIGAGGAWSYVLNNANPYTNALAEGEGVGDAFLATVTDDKGASATVLVAVNITGTNDAPVAKNDSVTTDEDTAISIAVLANDTDVDLFDTKMLLAASGAQHGTLALSGSNVVYTPSLNYNGADSFNYVMEDSAHVQRTATVNVTVSPLSDSYTLSNLAVNGSFEQGSGITGWTATGDGVDRVVSSGAGDQWQSGDGTCSLDLNALHPGGVQQTLATTPGVQYTVGFDLSKNPGGHADHATVQVSAAGGSQLYTFSDANSGTDMMWSQQTFTFVATGTSTTLSFASTYPTDDLPHPARAEGPALDEVVVVQNRVINDFTTGSGGDVLQLHDLLTSINAPHDSSAFSGGFLRFLDSNGPAQGGDTLVQVDANGGGNSYLTVATLLDTLLTQANSQNYVL